MSEKEKLLIIGNYCKTFRTEILGLSLNEFEKLTGCNIKTISSFENGRSTNITHLFKYLDLCATNGNRIKFLKGLNSLLGGM